MNIEDLIGNLSGSSSIGFLNKSGISKSSTVDKFENRFRAIAMLKDHVEVLNKTRGMGLIVGNGEYNKLSSNLNDKNESKVEEMIVEALNMLHTMTMELGLDLDKNIKK